MPSSQVSVCAEHDLVVFLGFSVNVINPEFILLPFCYSTYPEITFSVQSGVIIKYVF